MNFYIIIPLIIIFICLIIIFYFIPWKTLIASLVLPRPIIGVNFIKFLLPLIGHAQLSSLITLREQVEKRFNSIHAVPIIFVLGDKIELGENIISESTNGLSWCINSKLVIVCTTNLEEITILMTDLFEGRAATALCIQTESETIKSIDNIIKIQQNIILFNKITDSLIPTIILIKVNLPSLNNLKILGIETRNPSKAAFYEAFDLFFTNLLNTILNLQITDFLQDLLYFHENKEEIVEILDIVSETEMPIMGCFFQTSIESIDKLFNDFLYEKSSQARYLSNHAMERRTKIFQQFLIIVTSIALILGIVYTVKKINSIDQMLDSVKIAEKMLVEKNNDFVTTEYIQKLATNNISFLNKQLLKKEIEDIEHIRNYMINNGTKILDGIQNIYEEVFNLSPIETNTFHELESNTNLLSSAFSDLYYFVHNENKSSVLNSNLQVYADRTKFKIIQNFSQFFHNFSNFILMHQLDIVNKTFQSLNSKNVTLDNLVYLYENLRNLKELSNNSANRWWILSTLGEPYDHLLAKVKSIPLIGQQIFNELQFMQENALKSFKETILDVENIYCGKFFNIKDQKLVFTDKLQEFVNLIYLLTKEPVLQLKKDEGIWLNCKAKEVVYFDLNKLDNIMNQIEDRNRFIQTLGNYSVAIRSLITNISNNVLSNFIINGLKDSISIGESNNIEDMTFNIKQSREKLDKINNFLLNVLQISTNELSFLCNNTANVMAEQIENILRKMIFSSYTFLNDWDGNDLYFFLFQCTPEEISDIISKTARKLKQMKENINNILPRIIDRSRNQFLKSIGHEIQKYEDGEKNSIAEFENFVVGLKNWTPEWKQEINKLPSENNFFHFQTKAFESALITQTNKLVLQSNNNLYDEIIKFFNDKLAGKFPFGSKDNVELDDLIRFLNKYKNVRNKLLQDKNFIKTHNLEQLDDLLNFFIVEENNVFIDLQITYHVKMKGIRNDSLILNYLTRIGDSTYENDSLNIKYNIKQPFNLTISIANSSFMKVGSSLSAKTNDNSIQFDFLDNYGFLKFVKQMFFQKQNKQTFLKFVIPLVHKEEKIQDSIIIFAKINNYPLFPNSL